MQIPATVNTIGKYGLVWGLIIRKYNVIINSLERQLSNEGLMVVIIWGGD